MWIAQEGEVENEGEWERGASKKVSVRVRRESEKGLEEERLGGKGGESQNKGGGEEK